MMKDKANIDFFQHQLCVIKQDHIQIKMSAKVKK